ncbi:alpha/beta hydrolase [Mesorhizobium caraganae]|uniref:alpha/beta hydrolase n=1 Tax=Mesorhizobium caraganae TaxID=483206 RepID=UPI003F507145
MLIFVPGFDNGHAEAVYRFAQLVHDARISAAPVPFTWPSRGNVLDYVYDRESTIYSRFGLDAVLNAAVDSPDVAEVVILAHSMGMADHGGLCATWPTGRKSVAQNSFSHSRLA